MYINKNDYNYRPWYPQEHYSDTFFYKKVHVSVY